MGILQQSPINGRYFKDSATNEIVYLTGQHNWYVVQDSTNYSYSDPFDFTAYLQRCRGLGHNFMRFWVWESPRAMPYESDSYTFTPLPWARTGPSNAADGGLRFDLSTFDSTYFTRLRDRLIEAIAAGFYCGVQLFQGWSISNLGGTPNPGTYHPFKSGNNINSVSADSNADGNLDELFTSSGTILTYQQNYVDHVIDTINDLDEIIWEIGNELPHASTSSWQQNMADHIATYESGKAKQHPIWLTATISSTGPNTWMTGATGSVTAISLHDISGNLQDNHLVADGGKVWLTDTDHIDTGEFGDDIWVWKAFLRGHNPLFMDGITTTFGASANANKERTALGDTRRYAKRLNLASVLPDATAYMLSGNGQFLILSPSGGSVSLPLTNNSVYSMEWFILGNRDTVQMGSFKAKGTTSFVPPTGTAAVLFVQAANSSADSYPQNAVLDTFNRADGTLGSAWTDHLDNTSTVARIVSNMAAPNATGTTYSDAYWNAGMFNADQEVFATYGAVGDEFDLLGRVTNPNTGTASGYLVFIDGASNHVELLKLNSGSTYTSLGFTSHTPTVGATYIFRMVGNTLSLYQGSTLIYSLTDNTYNSAGYIGFGLKGNTIRLDDFGGGNYTAPENPVILTGTPVRRIR